MNTALSRFGHSSGAGQLLFYTAAPFLQNRRVDFLSILSTSMLRILFIFHESDVVIEILLAISRKLLYNLRYSFQNCEKYTFLIVPSLCGIIVKRTDIRDFLFCSLYIFDNSFLVYIPLSHVETDKIKYTFINFGNFC